VSARGIGSEVGYVKSLLQGFVYRRLPSERRLVFAAGARLGLAAGFAREVPRLDESGQPVLDPGGNPVFDDVDDLPASERFFAGGDTTVRGFALDRLGDEETIDTSGFPLGGNALVILNAELRVPIGSSVVGVAFVDAGNVFARANDLAFGDLRAAVGVGVRYQSVIGPLRVDLGRKLGRLQILGTEPEDRWQVHLSFGHAF
jgi:outer membrane translocation and assembly module TamA